MRGDAEDNAGKRKCQPEIGACINIDCKLRMSQVIRKESGNEILAASNICFRSPGTSTCLSRAPNRTGVCQIDTTGQLDRSRFHSEITTRQSRSPDCLLNADRQEISQSQTMMIVAIRYQLTDRMILTDGCKLQARR